MLDMRIGEAEDNTLGGGGGYVYYSHFRFGVLCFCDIDKEDWLVTFS